MSSFKLSPGSVPSSGLTHSIFELSSSVTAVSAAPGRHNSLLLAKIVVVFQQLALLLLPLRHSASFLLPPVVVVVHFHEQFALRTRNLSALYTRHMLRLH